MSFLRYWKEFITIFVGFIFICGASQVVQPVFPLVAQTKGISAAWVVTAFSAGIFCSIPFAGIFFDRKRKTAVIVSAVGFFICTVLFAMVDSPEIYIIGRFVQGFFFSMGLVSISAMLTWILRRKSKSETGRNKGMGLISAVSPVSMFLAVFGGILYQHASELPFLLSVLLAGGALMLFAGSKIPPVEEKSQQTKSWWKAAGEQKKTVIKAVSEPKETWKAVLKTVKATVEPKALLPATPAFCVVFLNVSLISFWLVEHPDYPQFFGVLGVIQLGVRFLQGWIKNPYRTILGGFAIMGVGWIILVVYPSAYILGGLLFGLGYGTAQARIWGNAHRIVDDNAKSGRTEATCNLLGQVGAVIGTLSGLLVPHVLPNYSHLWGWSLVFVPVGIVLTWNVRRYHPYRPEPLKQ